MKNNNVELKTFLFGGQYQEVVVGTFDQEHWDEIKTYYKGEEDYEHPFTLPKEQRSKRSGQEWFEFSNLAHKSGIIDNGQDTFIKVILERDGEVITEINKSIEIENLSIDIRDLDTDHIHFMEKIGVEHKSESASYLVVAEECTQLEQEYQSSVIESVPESFELNDDDIHPLFTSIKITLPDDRVFYLNLVTGIKVNNMELPLKIDSSGKVKQPVRTQILYGRDINFTDPDERLEEYS
jgi:hypothetical protein